MSFPFLQPYAGLSNSLQTAQAVGGAVGGWVELGRTTLGSSGSTIDVTSLPDKRYYMFIADLPTSGSVDHKMTFNNDTGSNYARRSDINGGAENVQTSQSNLFLLANNQASKPTSYFGYIANKSSNEKLLIAHSCYQDNAGAGTAPGRAEDFGKWSNTTNSIDQITINTSLGSFSTGAELVVLGWDPADTHTSNFWEELASVDITSASNLSSGTITAKKYLWYQYYLKLGATQNGDITYNNDTGSNYAIRFSDDGASDGTATSATIAGNDGGGTSGEIIFANVFVINNSSNEKLAIAHFTNSESSGAANAPTRREAVHKWVNTSSQITEIDLTANTGTFTSGSLRVWGAD